MCPTGPATQAGNGETSVVASLVRKVRHSPSASFSEWPVLTTVHWIAPLLRRPTLTYSPLTTAYFVMTGTATPRSGMVRRHLAHLGVAARPRLGRVEAAGRVGVIENLEAAPAVAIVPDGNETLGLAVHGKHNAPSVLANALANHTLDDRPAGENIAVRTKPKLVSGIG
jgi:hypothetical protein